MPPRAASWRWTASSETSITVHSPTFSMHDAHLNAPVSLSNAAARGQDPAGHICAGVGSDNTVALSFPALFLAASYPFTKRFLALPQAYLGVAFGFGIPMAYAAQTGQVPWVALVIVLANVFWAVAYDTEYAMVDRADDLRIGIRTSAITFGRFDVAAASPS